MQYGRRSPTASVSSRVNRLRRASETWTANLVGDLLTSPGWCMSSKSTLKSSSWDNAYCSGLAHDVWRNGGSLLSILREPTTRFPRVLLQTVRSRPYNAVMCRALLLRFSSTFHSFHTSPCRTAFVLNSASNVDLWHTLFRMSVINQHCQPWNRTRLRSSACCR